MFDKFKLLVQDNTLFHAVIIVLVAASSFGLGRLSGGDEGLKSAENKPIVMQGAAATALAVSSSTPKELANGLPSEGPAAYVGSKNGTKYHALWCPGAGQIKEENKVYFANKQEAEAAGYTPAANCKGI